MASKCFFGLILRLLPGDLGRREYKPKRPLWLQSACLALFCASFREVWGEGNISQNGHFGFKVLVWLYSAAPSGRFGEKEIEAKTATLASECLFGLILRLLPGGLGRRKYKPKRPLWLQSACLALFCGSFREVWGEGNISQNGHFGFKVLLWPYSAAPSGRICHWLLVNSVHSPEKEVLRQLCAFRGCGRICHWLRLEFRSQPRKRAFEAIVCFSGLWWDLSLAACGIPSTAPKTSLCSNCVLFGAVVGSVIGCLCNSCHSPENELLRQLFAFRGCGRICHWLLVEFRPQPRKRASEAIVCFSGLWEDLSLAALRIAPTAPKTSLWSNCVFLGAVVGSVIGCLWNSCHSAESELLQQFFASRGCGRICHWLLVELRPQPRKRASEAIVCFSGLWQDLPLAPCGIPSTAPKTSFCSNCVLFGAVVGSVIGCLWNSCHSPENELLKQLCAFRGCGRICHWLLVEFLPQPRKRASEAIVCFSGLWLDLPLAPCGILSTAPKTSFWSNCVLFGAVVGSDKHILYLLSAFGTPSTAPKTSLWSNCMLFGAVVRSDKHILYWLAACGIPSAAPTKSFWSNSFLFLLCAAENFQITV